MLDERTTTFSWEDDAAAKTEKALALAKQMIEWFAANYEDPAESTPFCSEEGGYMYLCGGPYGARDEIEVHFPAAKHAVHLSAEEFEEVVVAVVEEIEAEGITEWAKVLHNDHSEWLLYAAPHEWGPGHVHSFNEQTGKTLCGRTLETCPGTLGMGDATEITCKACLNALKRKERA